jgi:predicted component of type VI protein secretion system
MAASVALLEAVAGNAAGTTILVEDELVIGRHASGAGRLADDEEISRAHARVTLDASNFCAIEDLGSTNGTFVNGLRISSPLILSEGDTIELGGTTLVVRELPRMEPEPQRQPAGSASGPTSATIVSEEAPAVAAPPTESPAAPVGTEPFLPESPPTPRPGKVGLQLEVDFDRREAQVVLDDGTEPLRLVFDGSAWRPAPTSPTEKGTPA